MARALYEIRIFAFIRIHCLGGEEITVALTVGELRIIAFVPLGVESRIVACAVSEVWTIQSVPLEAEDSTVTCALGGNGNLTFGHDPLHYVFLMNVFAMKRKLVRVNDLNCEQFNRARF